MKKLLFLVICLFSYSGIAQTDLPLFDLNNKNIIGTETTQSFAGAPVILIEKEEKEEPEINRAEKLPPPKLTSTPVQIPIKTPMGHKETAAFINHITDIISFIQILDDESIKITEQIQFVTTEDQTVFERFFPVQKSDDIQILSVLRDQTSIPFHEELKKNGRQLTLNKKLPKGVHRITIQYLLKGAITHNKSLADITIPVLSGTQSRMIERLTAMVMLPRKSNFYQKDVLFGSNNITIPETVETTIDRTGNIIFQNTHPLPAYANMKIHLLIDSLPPAPTKEFKPRTIINLVYLGILMFYAVLSILVCRYKKWKKPLAKSKKISPILWIYGMGEVLSKSTIDYLKNQKVSLYSASSSRILPRIAAFFRFNWEYVIGVIILIIATEMMARYYTVTLTRGDKSFLIFFGIMALVIIDIYGTRVELKRLKETLKETLLNTPQGLNLASRDIQTYYIKAVCFDFYALWEKKLISNNPSYQQLSFLRKEKI